MKKTFLFFFLTIPFFTSTISFAGSFDENLSKISGCDDFFPCQQAGQAESKVKKSFQGKLGVGFDADPAPLPPKLQRPRITGFERLQLGRRAQPENTESSASASPESKNVSGENQGSKQSTNEMQSWNGFSKNTSQDSNNDSGRLHMGGSSIHGSSPNVKGGLLYSDESPSINAGTQKLSQEFGSESSVAKFVSHPVEQNRRSESSATHREIASSDPSNGGHHFPANANTNNLINSGSGSSRVKAIPSQGTLLGQIATALKDGLNSFWGGLSHSSVPEPNTGQGGQNPSQQKHQYANTKIKSHELLRANFEKYKRGLANSIEFGDSSTFIFERICEQYRVYAKTNRIPSHKAECPMN